MGGPLQQFRLLLSQRQELVDRVEVLVLYSRTAVELPTRDRADYVLRPPVAVADAVADDLAPVVKQDEVHTPGVDRDHRGLGAPGDAFHDLVEERLKVPAQMAMPPHQTVLEAVDGAAHQAARLQMTCQELAARGPDVYSQHFHDSILRPHDWEHK